MSGFNKTQSTPKTATENLAGGAAYTISPELELVTMLLTSFVEDTAYELKADRLARLKAVLLNVDPLFAAKAAVFARHEYGMRSITHAMAGELAHVMELRLRGVPGAPTQNPEWLKTFFQAIVRRPDDISNIVAHFLAKYGRDGKNGRRRGLTNAMRKGFGARIATMDAYQLGKYKGEGKAWKMVDLVNLLRPDGAGNSALKALMNGTLETPQTWEVGLSEAGKVDALEGETKEEAVLEAKGTAWHNLIRDKKIGYLALLRNLRNILAHAPACIPMVCEQLVDEKAIKKALIFPFQFLVAITELVKLNGNRALLEALAKAVNLSTGNLPRLPGRTLIALDCSGSMTTTMAQKASYRCMDIAALFAAALYKTQDADMVLFGSTIGTYNPPVSSDTTMLAQDLARREMGGTNMAQVFDTCKGKYDRIFILSDGEAWQQQKATGVNLEKMVQRLGARPSVYMWDFSGGGTSQFHANQVTMLSGFSEKVFDLLEQQEQDKNALVNRIKAYALDTPLQGKFRLSTGQGATLAEGRIPSMPDLTVHNPRPGAPKGAPAPRTAGKVVTLPKAKKAPKKPAKARKKAKKGGKK